MSTRSRIAALVALVVLAVASFLVLQPADEDPATTTRPAATTPGAATEGSSATTPGENDAAADPAGATRSAGETDATGESTPTPAPAPAPRRIRVRDGRPVGGLAELTVRRGERIRFTVTADAPESVHLHGYDVEEPVGPGEPARFSVPATIEGVFEVELERSGVQVAQLTVEP